MPTFTPVDDDPFAKAPSNNVRLEPVDYDPFKEPVKQTAPASGVFPAVDNSGLASVPAAMLPGSPPVSAPPPSPAPIQSDTDPGWLQESLSQTKRGWHSFQRGRYLMQHTLGTREGALEDFLNAVQETPQVEAENVVSPQTRAAEEELSKLSNSGAGGLLPSLGVYARNPRLAVGTFLQSAPSMIPSMATVPLGMVAGAAGGPVGASVGARVGAGFGSALGDFGSAFEDYVNENFKPKNKDEWRAVLADKEKFNDALKYAAIHSGTVGAFDAAGMQFGGAVGGKIVSAAERATGGRALPGVARHVAVGVAGAPASSLVGGAGEAAGEFLGAGKFDPTQVAGEIVGGFVGDVATTGVESVTRGGVGTPHTPVTPGDVTQATTAMGAQPQAAPVFQPAPEDIAGTFSQGAPSPTFYSPLRRYIEEKGPGAADASTWQATIKNAPGVKQEEVNDIGLPDYFVDKPGKITKRELLDHLDENAIQVQETIRTPQKEDVSGMNGWTQVGNPPGHAQYEAYTLPGERQGYTELTMHLPTRNVGQIEGEMGWVPEGAPDNVQRDFVGGHYPEPNVIAHARVTDRIAADGTPMALIEEIQSDWHQQGRKIGYRGDTSGPAVAPKPTGEVVYDPAGDVDFPWRVMIDGREDNRTKTEDGARSELQYRILQLHDRAQRDLNRQFESRVPQGPFKQSWDELAFRRMLRWAADKGYRRVAWVNAAEQSRRYPGDARRDAGMQQFYDRVIPSMAKKWAKRLGGTVGESQVSGVPSGFRVMDSTGAFIQAFNNAEQAERMAAILDGSVEAGDGTEITTVQHIDLPQNALDVINMGLPLYSQPMAPSNNVQVTPSYDAQELGVQLGEALQALAKRLDLRIPISLTFHDGLDVKYKVNAVNKQGRPIMRTRREKALGMAVRYRSNRPEIHVALGWHKTAAEVWATMTHELGHIVMAHKFETADANTKTSLRAAHDEWLAKNGTTRNWEQLTNRRDNAVIALHKTRSMGTGNPTAEIKTPSERKYWMGFEEWFAEQVARWATTDQKPLSLVEKFFSGLGKTLKNIFQQAAAQFGLPFEPTKVMSDWLNSFHTDSEPFAEGTVKVNDVKTQVENQRHTGPHEEAVERQPETVAVREMVGQVFHERPPKEVQETIAYADKFNKIYKWMMGIHQVAQRNNHILPLQEYVETIAVAQLTKQNIMIRAQEVLKAWNRLGGKQGDAVAALLDAVANMEYRTPAEVKQKVARFPTNNELNAMVQKYGVSQEGLAVFREIATTFQEHLTRYEAILRGEANKITDPQERADRHDQITLQIKTLKMKPYFPFMRFGEHTLTIRNAANQVIHFETFERVGIYSAERRRAAAVREITPQLQPGDTIQLGVMNREAKPLMGVPAQLLDLMEAKLTLTDAQRDALEQLKFELSPAQSFKHRFQHKNRIAGYSQDFRRAYANYFFHGANHFMKTQYADRLRGLVKATHDESKRPDFPMDATHRHEIVNYMEDHVKNWLDPKSDWAAIRSIAFMWALAYSPAAAAQNLTQTLMTTYPFLAHQFGDAKAVAAIMKTGADFTTFYKKGTLAHATDFELRAIARGISDGIINEAMAPELAGFAEGRTLGIAFGGNEIQRYMQGFNELGAKMFELAEQVNRRLVFRATLKLAQENPGAKYNKDVQVKHRLHYDALRKEGWTEAEATAYVAARDATITTQFQYGREYAPRAMRGKLRSVFVFKTFIQSYVMFLANYPKAAIRSVLILGFLGGLMGVPGADDLKEILKALGWQFFGKDFDLEKEARKLIIEMVGKDKNGADVADIVLHGIARKGYGIPAFMDMLGGTVGVDVPMPTFDRSKSISAGTLLPVELGKLFGPPTQDQDKVIADQLQKASGAVFGAGFNIYKAMTNTKLDWNDAKRWERAVPRALGSISHAARLGIEGYERDSRGAPIKRLPYDVRDTEQLMEVIGVGMGYTPLKSSLYWDRTIAGMEAVKLWDIRREGLMKQMGNAVLGRDQKEIDRVREAIKKFNADLPVEARGKAISSDAMRQSIGGQARSRAARDQELSVRKSDIPILQEVQKMYPQGTVTSVKKVRGTP